MWVFFFTRKPNPWGIKVWCAADPRSGYMLEFDIYVGHVLALMPHGLGHHVIMKMADRFLERGHHLFFDNCFSSVKLGQDLEGKGTYMCSTIRMNRSGWPKELNAQCAKIIKKAGDVHFCQYGNTVATQWKEKRPVAILYTNTQPEMGEAERKARGGGGGGGGGGGKKMTVSDCCTMWVCLCPVQWSTATAFQFADLIWPAGQTTVNLTALGLMSMRWKDSY